MGKKQQAQRTKGNVKPSSSLRAAELLEASGGSMPTFTSFSSLDTVSAVNEERGEILCEDPEFSIVLKRLSKKDATTKLKAMQEFSRLCQEKDTSILVAILPQWPRVFGRMSIDEDNCVREATYQAFEQLVVRVRRSLAPHLRGLMGSWLVAQCDCYAPAASAARSAFNAAFVPSKQAEAVAFCRVDILLHIENILFKQTPLSLSDPRTTTEEERENKYQRLLAASLEAFNLFMTLLPSDQHEQLCSNYQQIFGNPKMWQFSKHTVGNVRSGFYNVVAALCSRCPVVAVEFGDQISKSVMYSFEESDPNALVALWQAVLHIVVTVQDCWCKINPRKGVFPKLWTLLKEGGRGCAASTFSSLLPFVSRLPHNVRGEGLGFYEQFFGSLKAGLMLDRVQMSTSECNAVVKALAECVRFCIGRHLVNSEHDTLICGYLIDQVLLPLMESSFTERRPALSNSPLYPSVINLLVYLHSAAVEDDAVNGRQVAAAAVYQKFTEGLAKLVIEKLASEEDVIIVRLASFVACLSSSANYAETPTSAPSKSVRFTESETGSAKKNVISPATTSPFSSDLDGRLPNSYPHVITDTDDSKMWQMICESSWVAASTARSKCSQSHLHYFSTVFGAFISDRLLSSLLSHEAGKQTGAEFDSVHVALEYFRQVIIPWISSCCQQPANNNETEDAYDRLVSVAWVNFCSIPEADKPEALSCMQSELKVDRTALIQFCHVMLTSTEPHSMAVTSWLCGSSFGQFMVALTRELCQRQLVSPSTMQGKLVQSWKLLRACLSSNCNPEISVHHDYMNSMFNEIYSSLPSTDQLLAQDLDAVNRCVIFVADIAQCLFSGGSQLVPKFAEPLLSELFRVCTSLCDSERVESLAQQKIHKSWIKGLDWAIKSAKQEETFSADCVNKFASLLVSEVVKSGISVSKLQYLCQAACDLVTVVMTNVEQSQCTSSDELSKNLLKVTRSLCPDLALDSLESRLMLAAFDRRLVLNSEPVQLNLPHNFEQLIQSAAFIAKLFVSIVALKGSEELEHDENQDDIDGVQVENKSVYHVVSQDFDTILDVTAVVACSRIARTDSTVSSVLPSSLFECLESDLASLICSQQAELLLAVFEKSMKYGGMWSLALDLILDKVDAVELEKVLPVEAESYMPLCASVANTLVVVLSHLTSRCCVQFAPIQVALFMSCSVENVTCFCDGAVNSLSILNKILTRLRPLESVCDGKTGEPVLDADSVHSILAVLKTWRDDRDDLYLFATTNVDNVDWPVVAFNIEVATFLTHCVNQFSDVLTVDEWDFVLCGAVAWLQSVQEACVQRGRNTAVLLLANSVFYLLVCVGHLMQSKDEKRAAVSVTSLFNEWNDVFAPSVFESAVTLFMNFVDAGNSEVILPDVLLQRLGALVSLCPFEQLSKHKLPCRLVAEDDDLKLPDSVLTLLNHCCAVLLSSQRRSCKLTMYHVLAKLVPTVVSCGATNADAEDARIHIPSALITGIASSGRCLQPLLDAAGFGEPVSLDPKSSHFSAAMSYALIWRVLLKLLKSASMEQRAGYAEQIRQRGLTDHLLRVLFRLLPQSGSVTTSGATASAAQSADAKATATKDLFAESPSLSVLDNESAGFGELVHLACDVYMSFLRTLPAVVRQWWTGLDKRSSDIVNRFTARFVSPVICSDELSVVQRCDDIDGMKVRVRQTVREVIALYAVGDVTTELVVTLPANFPLGAVSVGGDERRVGVQKTQWRKWLLQLTTFLTYQNGSVLDGLALWKRSVDKRFDGIEECTICFSVLHSTSCQLPRKQCRTCRKHFHSECLYRWFETNNTSSCPLCRNLF